jgi:hypothetical protein
MRRKTPSGISSTSFSQFSICGTLTPRRAASWRSSPTTFTAWASVLR